MRLVLRTRSAGRCSIYPLKSDFKSKRIVYFTRGQFEYNNNFRKVARLRKCISVRAVCECFERIERWKTWRRARGSSSFILDFRESLEHWLNNLVRLFPTLLYKYSAHKYVYTVNRVCAKTVGSVSKNGTKGWWMNFIVSAGRKEGWTAAKEERWACSWSRIIETCTRYLSIGDRERLLKANTFLRTVNFKFAYTNAGFSRIVRIYETYKQRKT